MFKLKTTFTRGATLALGLSLVALGAWAAPGEDPVNITGRVSYLQLPTAPSAKSTDITYRKDLPDDMQAKIARYTAKAYSADIGDIQTEKDVVQSVQTQAGKVTCVQSVGSVTAPSTGVSMGSNQQVVVLRGDLVNLCK
ncbi:hypothetical protein [Ottowia sp.]|uniref:hypothetical protein n=1 Tax=Ottowia sp. TaxID=1898956 RepID=UPI0039E69AA4